MKDKGYEEETNDKKKVQEAKGNDALWYQDGGYAWFVVLATWIYAFVLGGTYKGFGVLYLGLLDLHQAGEFKTSMVNTVYLIFSCVGSLITGWLSDRYSMRLLVIFGAILSTAGFVMSSFASNIYYVIVGYGIVTGIGSALMDSPLMCAMGQYWNKRTSLANGIAYSGASFGTLLLPLFYALLMEEYTTRGALLFAGAFYLNGCISGILLRPRPLSEKKEKHIEKKCLTEDGPTSICKTDDGTRGYSNQGFCDSEICIDEQSSQEESKPEPIVKNYIYGMEQHRHILLIPC